MRLTCFECTEIVDADNLEQLGDRFLGHARTNHEWPYPDQAIRNYAEATQRLTGPSQRLDEIGEVDVHPVTEERIADWLAFFDHDAFVGKPEWAACYCLEPFIDRPGEPPLDEALEWGQRRERMIGLLRDGTAFGYLAYVDGRPAGWVNASSRAAYRKYEDVDPQGPNPGSIAGISCFVVAPPYRNHGLARALMERVLADAAERGVDWVEGYPFNDNPQHDGDGFRGPRRLYDSCGFEPVEIRDRDTVVRRRA